jgi:hypothetical protein
MQLGTFFHFPFSINAIKNQSVYLGKRKTLEKPLFMRARHFDKIVLVIGNAGKK